MSLRVVSLFAGIGGFDLGFERAGMKTVAFVERDANCRKLLAAKFPDAIALDDVCTAGAHNSPRCDVLCGGWPCQDLSVAGKRAGLVNGSRSNLFYELTRLIRELRPRYLVGENVPGLLSSDGGRDFARVLGELGQCGARDIAWRILDAQYLGVAQRRRRVFIVADFGGERAAEILSLAEGMRGHPAPSREAREGVTGAPAACLNSGGNSGGFRTEPGAHLVAVRTAQTSANGHGVADDVAHTLDQANGQAVCAFSCKDSGQDAGALSPTRRSMNFAGSHINGGGQVAVAFNWQGGGTQTSLGYDPDAKITGTLQVGQGVAVACFDERQVTSKTNRSRCEADVCGTQHATPHSVAFTIHGTDKTANVATPAEVAGSIRTKAPGSQENSSTTIALTRSAVRRLTPRECERLQGFPDDWTAGFSDSTRYRMLGNAVAVPCAEWIGKRLARAINPPTA